ncbi:hypothetical protein SVA_0216 [Sulfurifustis variabilis]|uniref:Uncharacterized protein n=1 Tax=Sulfurifustis variabilis TaxID=1675686 RepID=A0A1B4V043_9GAMM|nr:hypothetical protein [Sulfurifustis variabilis]BAU46798.1 hypothetical protein SVA_0216 [Sulfurifustis variabilis]
MAAKKIQEVNETAEVLKNMLIVQLALAGVQQRAIRNIVGCDINRVSRIARHLKANKSDEEG